MDPCVHRRSLACMSMWNLGITCQHISSFRFVRYRCWSSIYFKHIFLAFFPRWRRQSNRSTWWMNIVGIIFPKQLHQKSCNLIKVKSNYVCVIFTHTKIYMISVWIFSRDSDLTSTNVSLSVSPSVCHQYVELAHISNLDSPWYSMIILDNPW